MARLLPAAAQHKILKSIAQYLSENRIINSLNLWWEICALIPKSQRYESLPGIVIPYIFQLLCLRFAKNRQPAGRFKKGNGE